jgi:tRNA dimethylallyltransferase
LTASLGFIIPRINARIQQRLQAGVMNEVTELQQRYGERLCEQVKTTLGFNQIMNLIEGKISDEQAILEWQTAEKQYAQRQLTWWKSKPFVRFFAVDEQADWQQQAIFYVSDKIGI